MPPKQQPIRDLQPGEVGFVAPWGVELDSNGQAWINGQWSSTGVPWGTKSHEVQATPDGHAIDPHGKVYISKPK